MNAGDRDTKGQVGSPSATSPAAWKTPSWVDLRAACSPSASGGPSGGSAVTGWIPAGPGRGTHAGRKARPESRPRSFAMD